MHTAGPAELPPGVLAAQVANAVLAAAALCTVRGLPMQVAFIECTPLGASFRASYAQHGRRRYVFTLADASGAQAQLQRVGADGAIDMSLFDQVDEAFTSAFPEALRETVGALYTSATALADPAVCAAPQQLQ